LMRRRSPSPSQCLNLVAVSGQGSAPEKSDIEWMRSQGVDVIPGDGLLPAVVPSVVDTWVEALVRFGIMGLGQTLAPAIELAQERFPMYSALRNTISSYAERFVSEWPSTARVFLPEGKILDEGEIFRQSQLANTLLTLAKAERKASHQSRQAGLKAARDEFFTGKIARRIAQFVEEPEALDATGTYHRALLGPQDLERYHARIEEQSPLTFEYEIFKCGPWTQGPVFLQQLKILEGYDLRALGLNFADYIHVLVEAAKLAFADRERYYGDPEFDHVSMTMLLSDEHANTLRQRIDMQHASTGITQSDTSNIERVGAGTVDTTHLDVIDRWRNMISATQSGGWIQSSPLIEGLGFALSTRGQMFCLDPKKSESLAPGKRPRTTLTPFLAFKNGKPFMVFGTPGGDQQDRWSLQFFLNLTPFGMNLQEAVDAPSFYTLDFPSSFYPRKASPREVQIEDTILTEIREALERRGHILRVTPSWQNGRVTAAARDPRSGVVMAAASRKMMFGNTAHALGW